MSFVNVLSALVAEKRRTRPFSLLKNRKLDKGDETLRQDIHRSGKLRGYRDKYMRTLKPVFCDGFPGSCFKRDGAWPVRLIHTVPLRNIRK
jgi:hypothetical protein